MAQYWEKRLFPCPFCGASETDYNSRNGHCLTCDMHWGRSRRIVRDEKGNILSDSWRIN